jgi:cytochrome c55X
MRILFCFFIAALFIPWRAQTAETGSLDANALTELLRQDCGSCHGITLTGGLGPSLRPEAISGKSDEALARIVLDGVPNTPMPPWRGLLSEAEVKWLITALRSGEVK